MTQLVGDLPHYMAMVARVEEGQAVVELDGHPFRVHSVALNQVPMDHDDLLGPRTPIRITREYEIVLRIRPDQDGTYVRIWSY